MPCVSDIILLHNTAILQPLMNNISHNSTGNHLLNVRNVRGQFEKLIPKGASEIFGFGFIFMGTVFFYCLI